MYIENFKKKNSSPSQSTPQRVKPIYLEAPDEREEQLIEAPHEELIAQYSQDVRHHWQAPEFETYEKDNKWYLAVTVILLIIIGYAIYTNSPIMAITFILIGVVGYIYSHKEPRIIDFMITEEGIVAGKDLFDFDNIRSFWIFYEPPYRKYISLHLKSSFTPFITIPINQEDPVKIREALLDYVREREHDLGTIELIRGILRI